MWSDSLLDRLNFFCVELNTFEDFDVELDYQCPLFSLPENNEQLGLAFVMKSMTNIQREVLKLIAQH